MALKRFINTTLKRIVSIFLVVAVICSLIWIETKVMIPKWQTTAEWKVSTIIDGFYQVPDNSVDVLVMGSSHAVSGLSAARMYYDYGIASYSISTAGQPMFATYYWLKEVLRTQHPKKIILDVDTYFLKEAMSENGDYRKPIDTMHFTPQVKGEAIKELGAVLPGKEQFSYYFPLAKYKDRWKEVGNMDFAYLFKDKRDANLGWMLMDSEANEDYYGTTFADTYDGEVLERDNSGIVASLDELFAATDYNPENSKLQLLRISELCKAEGIELILIKLPCGGWTEKHHNEITLLANRLGLQFVDYNDAYTLSRLGTISSHYYADRDHMNMYGAILLTDEVVEALVLAGDNPVTPRQIPYFESLRGEYSYNLNAKLLNQMKSEDISKFFDFITSYKDRLTIVVSGCAESFGAVGEQTDNVLQNLGLSKYKSENLENQAYLAVLDGGKILSEDTQLKITTTGRNAGGIDYSITSKGIKEGGFSEILFDNNRYDFYEGGISFFIYDNINNEKIATATVYE